jgi:hypothetical protein
MSSEAKIYLDLPGLERLDLFELQSFSGKIPVYNGHIHTPYSFSAFRNIEQAFHMAKEEGISALGINDFYTTDGYGEFAALAMKYKVFPLFNIEFMALLKEEQQAGVRVNDPVNPGRMYLSGKGLSFPVKMSDSNRKKLENLQNESNRQTWQMVDKLNQFLAKVHAELQFEPADLQRRFAKNLLRERHIATAIRMAVQKNFSSVEEIRRFYNVLFQGKELKSSMENMASMENEIRNNLLKTGGPAYVEEDEKAFLSLEEVTGLIINAGGIPCYPVLLDDPKGNFTDFEKNWPEMAEWLIEKRIFMIELIPGRNDFSILKEFVRFFDQRGFVITFGSEHNTPQLDPLTITCRGFVPLDRELLEINRRGVSVIAAHQFLTASGRAGFPTACFPSSPEISELEQLGTKVISAFTQA